MIQLNDIPEHQITHISLSLLLNFLSFISLLYLIGSIEDKPIAIFKSYNIYCHWMVHISPPLGMTLWCPWRSLINLFWDCLVWSALDITTIKPKSKIKIRVIFTQGSCHRSTKHAGPKKRIRLSSLNEKNNSSVNLYKGGPCAPT